MDALLPHPTLRVVRCGTHHLHGDGPTQALAVVAGVARVAVAHRLQHDRRALAMAAAALTRVFAGRLYQPRKVGQVRAGTRAAFPLHLEQLEICFGETRVDVQQLRRRVPQPPAVAAVVPPPQLLVVPPATLRPNVAMPVAKEHLQLKGPLVLRLGRDVLNSFSKVLVEPLLQLVPPFLTVQQRHLMSHARLGQAAHPQRRLSILVEGRHGAHVAQQRRGHDEGRGVIWQQQLQRPGTPGPRAWVERHVANQEIYDAVVAEAWEAVGRHREAEMTRTKRRRDVQVYVGVGELEALSHAEKFRHLQRQACTTGGATGKAPDAHLNPVGTQGGSESFRRSPQAHAAHGVQHVFQQIGLWVPQLRRYGAERRQGQTRAGHEPCGVHEVLTERLLGQRSVSHQLRRRESHLWREDVFGLQQSRQAFEKHVAFDVDLTVPREVRQHGQKRLVKVLFILRESPLSGGGRVEQQRQTVHR
eukprot:scaffold334_cov241-Pinguiococcus_pyrenoidosus.AAC.77